MRNQTPERIASANRTILWLSGALGLYCLVRAGLDYASLVRVGGDVWLAWLSLLAALAYTAIGYALVRRGFRADIWKIYTYASYFLLIVLLALYWNTPRESGAPSLLLSIAFNLMCAAVAAGIFLRFRMARPRQEP